MLYLNESGNDTFRETGMAACGEDELGQTFLAAGQIAMGEEVH
jgi:hypothetical protein